MNCLRLVISIGLIHLFVTSAVADPGLLDAIRRLDTNNDGYIDPDELNDRVRRYLRPIADMRGLNLDRSNSIGRLEDSIRRYYSDQERRRSRYIVPDQESGVRGFRPDYEEPLIPEFGPADPRYPYSRQDIRDAELTLSRYDRNKDGYLDRYEARRTSWSGSDPFESDLDGDGRLSRLELAQRNARQRALQQLPDSRALLASRLDNAGSGRDSNDEIFERSSRSVRGSEGSSRSSRYLAYSVMSRYDRNRNGQLEENEWLATGIDRGEVDLDRDGIITRDELDAWIYRSMDGRANDLSDVLPTWFFDRDFNGDGQISMAEFADHWNDEKVREFERLDADGDGFLTVREMLQAKSIVGGSYASQKAEILMPRSIVISEIDIDDDIEIGELSLQLSITHTSVGQLDGFLIGPEGERIELFAEVGKVDDHFEDTVFDDKASTSITRGRPPFRGSYQPGALSKNEAGLSQFRGRSTKGLWQLMVRSTRSDRAGILHHWALIVKPAEEDPEDLNGQPSLQ